MPKMTKTSTLLVATLLAGPALAGGRPIPMVEVIDAPVVWAGGKAGDASIVQKAIIEGCVDKGWTCQLAAPGRVHGVLSRPDWKAEIDIPFTTTSYSIKYSASEHLDYDPAKKVIHRNFNRWLVLLRERIDLHTVAQGG